MNSNTTVDRLMIKSQAKELKSMLESAKENHPESAELLSVEEELVQLQEGLTSSDWGRLGVLFGLLWHKLDTIIKHLNDSNTSLKNIDKNTARR